MGVTIAMPQAHQCRSGRRRWRWRIGIDDVADLHDFRTIINRDSVRGRRVQSESASTLRSGSRIKIGGCRAGEIAIIDQEITYRRVVGKRGRQWDDNVEI